MTVTTKTRARRIAASAPSVNGSGLGSFESILAVYIEKAKSCPSLDPARVDRAAAILYHPDVHMQMWRWDASAEVLNVRSQTNPDVWYRTTATTCTCRDAELHGPDHRCKHMIAYGLLVRCEEFMALFSYAERAQMVGMRPRGPVNHDAAIPVAMRARAGLFKS
jgi:hypothetical protein